MKFRSVIADFMAQLIHLTSKFHIGIHNLLDLAEQGNIKSWKKNLLFLIRIYARLVPRKENDAAKDEDEDRRIL